MIGEVGYLGSMWINRPGASVATNGSRIVGIGWVAMSDDKLLMLMILTKKIKEREE